MEQNETIWTIIGVIALTTILVGSITYTIQKSKINDLQDQIKVLEDKISLMENEDPMMYEMSVEEFYDGISFKNTPQEGSEYMEKQFNVFDKLVEAALQKNLKALERLVELSSRGDGVYGEYLGNIFAIIVKEDPEFFFKNVYKNQYSNFVYGCLTVVLDDSIDLEKIRDLGEYSEDFLEGYDYFMKVEYWDIYENSQYGFSINYPSELNIEDKGEYIYFDNEDFHVFTIDYISSNSSIEDIARQDSHEELLDWIICEDPSGACFKEDDIRRFSNVTIDGQKAILVTANVQMSLIGEEPVDNTIYFYYVKYGNDAFKITVNSSIISSENLFSTEEFTDAIVSTFRKID